MERSFPEIPLPVDFDIEYFYDFSFCQLGVLGECLSLCVVGYYSPAVIWIMKEYKVQLSWTKIIVCKSIDSIAMVQMDTRWLCILSLYFHSLLTSPNWQWSKKKMINNNKQEELGCEIFSDTLTIFLILIDLVLWIMIYEFLWYNKAWKNNRDEFLWNCSFIIMLCFMIIYSRCYYLVVVCNLYTSILSQVLA